MKPRQFSPTVNNLEDRIALSGVSASTQKSVNAAFATFQSQYDTIIQKNSVRTALNSASAAVATAQQKLDNDIAFLQNFERQATNGAADIVTLGKQLNKASVKVADLVNAGIVPSVFATTLQDDKDALAAAKRSANKTSKKLGYTDELNALATNLEKILGKSSDNTIRALITGAPAPTTSSILIPTGTVDPSPGSLAASLSSAFTQKAGDSAITTTKVAFNQAINN